MHRKPAAYYVDHRVELAGGIFRGEQWKTDHLLCDECWNATRKKARLPVRVKGAPRQPCCRCAAATKSGI